MDTRIVKIEILLVKVPFSAPFRIALATLNAAETIVVRLTDSRGLTGVGEGYPSWFVTGETAKTAFEAAQFIAPLLLGANPLAVNDLAVQMGKLVVKNTAVRCAYDLALYDLLAKHANLPLYALLGGSRKNLHSNRTIGIDTPEVMAEAAGRHVQAGAVALKVKVGTGMADDLARVRAIRTAAGPGVSLRLDANQAWDESTALRMLQAVAEYEIEVCEQPLPYWNEAGLQRLHQRSPVPIMADESVFDFHDAHRLAAQGSVDFINIKLAKSAGLYGALKINAVSEAAGVECMLGGMSETRIGVSAGVHLMCACPNITLADLDSPFHFKDDPVQGGCLIQAGGQVVIEDVPGHGADLKPEYWQASQKVILSL